MLCECMGLNISLVRICVNLFHTGSIHHVDYQESCVTGTTRSDTIIYNNTNYRMINTFYFMSSLRIMER
jgi:hypothetical protein